MYSLCLKKVFSLVLPFLYFFNFAYASIPNEKAKVMIQEIKSTQDVARVLVPVKVEAKIQSLMMADVEGHVTKILKPLGSSVKAGEVVLYLENKDPGFTYAAVPIKAPVSGVISQFWTSQMTKVYRGDKLFTVINPKSLKLSAEFASADLPLIQTGLKGVFAIPQQSSKQYAIRVNGVSPLVDARTGTASAEIEFSEVEKILPPIGSIGQALFEIPKGKLILIPENSLVYKDGKPMIRVLKGENQFTKKPVELGEQRDSLYVVKSGLTSGEKIIVRSSRSIKEGESFEIEKTEGQN